MARDGIAVVIPIGGRDRLGLLAGTLAWLRRCDAVRQVIVSEAGEEPLALDIARQCGAEHLFTLASGPFDKVRAVNAGNLLVRSAEILWLDGDLLFERRFVARALREMRERALDFMFPFASIDYLDEQHSRDVLAGARHPIEGVPVRTLRPLAGGAPGGMGLVRTDFLRRHGGMIDGFQGWGHEDSAWVHKVSLLGRFGCTHREEQRAWHLFHPDSGSHSSTGAIAAMRNNPSYRANLALWSRIQRLRDGAELAHHFPPPKYASTPWPAGLRIAFAVAERESTAAAAMAADWARRLGRAYGIEVPIVEVDPAGTTACWSHLSADLIVGFARDSRICAALAEALQGHTAIIVPCGPNPRAGKWPRPGRPAIFARTAAQAERWRRRGFQVCAGHWGPSDTPGSEPVPPIVQPLSLLLGSPRSWAVEIVLDRAALPAPALDRPMFWYVGLHDDQGAEIARSDASRSEVGRTAATQGPIVIERRISCLRPPSTWTIWPTDRHGRWLDRIVGPVDGARLV
jgi:hypothetical protein